jgi:chloramphenicol 3-O phosphotransferase
MLSGPWLTFGVDTLITAMPRQGIEDGTLLRIEDDGRVQVGDDWRRIEACWYSGIASMATNGVGVILDEVLLEGARGQATLQSILNKLNVLWVGVQCAPDIAAAREARRPDRVPGMAKSQAAVVHDGVLYDIVVDTSRASAEACATIIVSKVCVAP